MIFLTTMQEVSL